MLKSLLMGVLGLLLEFVLWDRVHASDREAVLLSEPEAAPAPPTAERHVRFRDLAPGDVVLVEAMAGGCAAFHRYSIVVSASTRSALLVSYDVRTLIRTGSYAAARSSPHLMQVSEEAWTDLDALLDRHREHAFLRCVADEYVQLTLVRMGRQVISEHVALAECDVRAPLRTHVVPRVLSRHAVSPRPS